MITITLNRTPTGISTLDSIIKGGFPSGSLVLLIGDVGAGSTEFAYTCAVMHSMMKKNPENLKSIHDLLNMHLQKGESLKFPERICYISFTHTKDDIMAELGHTFPPEFASTLSENMIFSDLSPNSLFPSCNKDDWVSLRALRSVDEERQIINELVSTLDANAPNNLVIIDSLTSLFHACNRSMSWNDSISFLEELQRKSKKWDGLVYLLLGRGIFGKK